MFPGEPNEHVIVRSAPLRVFHNPYIAHFHAAPSKPFSNVLHQGGYIVRFPILAGGVGWRNHDDAPFCFGLNVKPSSGKNGRSKTL